jgi:LPS-assembly protein
MRAMASPMNSSGPRRRGAGRWRCVAACACLALAWLPAAAPAAEDLAESLWLPRDALPEPRRASVPEYCAGGYRELSFPQPRDVDSATFPLQARAESVAYAIDGEVVLLGDVHLEQGNRRADASRVTLDDVTRETTLSGGVDIVEPGLAMRGERAVVNLDTRAASVDDVQFVLLDSALRGRSEHIARDDAGHLVMTRSTFTRCEPGNRNWRISARSVKVEDGEIFGTARHAVVRVREVPILYTPYIRFPVTDDRQSGWMFPNVAHSDEDGLDVSLPYYLNLAPNYDATLMPRYISDRGEGLEGEFRHLSGWQQTTLTGGFLHEDQRFDGNLTRGDFDELLAQGLVTGEFEPEDRWLYGIDHEGQLGQFSTRIDYTAVSDRDYFRDLGSDLGVSSQIELERRGEIQYASGGLLMRLWAQRFQRLDEGRIDPYQRLPELELSYGSRLVGPLEWSLGAEFVSFDRDNDALTGVNAVVGERVHIEPRLRLPLATSWGFLTFAGGYRYTEYDLRDVPPTEDARPDRGIALGSAHGGLIFERHLDAFGTALVQTLEPQVYYLYQEFSDQAALPAFDATALTFSYSQLFRDNRFSGIDRIGDANQASVGVTTRFVNARSGREYLRASVGEIVYFRDRRVTLAGAPAADEDQPTSALAGELAASIARSWNVTGTLIWDPNDNQVDEGAVALQYRRDNRHIFNAGYRKRIQDDIQQSDLSLYWPVTRHFGLIGRWNYDFDSGRTVEGFGGIEYNDCCWQIRLMARRFLDSPTGRDLDTVEADEGIFLQIVFRGLAGVGSKVESVMERGIRGYRSETGYGP